MNLMINLVNAYTKYCCELKFSWKVELEHMLDYGELKTSIKVN